MLSALVIHNNTGHAWIWLQWLSIYHLIILIYIRKSPPPPQPYDHHDHHHAHGDEDAGDVKMIAVVIQFLPVIAPASSLGPDNHYPSSELADLGDDEDDDGGGDDGDNDGGGDDSDCGGVDIGGDGEILWHIGGMWWKIAIGIIQIKELLNAWTNFFFYDIDHDNGGD